MNEPKPNLLIPALIGGAFIGVTSALPILEYLNCACCMLIIGGGSLASYLYLKGYPSSLPAVTYGEGALLGLLTGIVGGVVWTAVGIPLHYVKVRMGLGMDDLTELDEVLTDPEIPEGMRRLLEGLFAEGPFSLGIILILVVIYFLASIIFATLGGVAGIAIFRKKSLPAAQTPPAPPSSPSVQADE